MYPYNSGCSWPLPREEPVADCWQWVSDTAVLIISSHGQLGQLKTWISSLLLSVGHFSSVCSLAWLDKQLVIFHYRSNIFYLWLMVTKYFSFQFIFGLKMLVYCWNITKVNLSVRSDQKVLWVKQINWNVCLQYFTRHSI